MVMKGYVHDFYPSQIKSSIFFLGEIKMQFKQLVETLDATMYGGNVPSEIINSRLNTGVYQPHLLYNLACHTKHRLACGTFGDRHLVALAAVEGEVTLVMSKYFDAGLDVKFHTLLASQKHPQCVVKFLDIDTLDNTYDLVVMCHGARHSRFKTDILPRCTDNTILIVDSWSMAGSVYTTIPVQYKRVFEGKLPLANTKFDIDICGFGMAVFIM